MVDAYVSLKDYDVLETLGGRLRKIVTITNFRRLENVDVVLDGVGACSKALTNLQQCYIFRLGIMSV